MSKYYRKNSECKMNKRIQKQNSLISKRENSIRGKRNYKIVEERENYDEKSDS